jgi:hypothetical protein
MKRDEWIPLIVPAERLSSAYRLSVIEEQALTNRQEFSIKVNLCFSSIRNIYFSDR